MALLLHKLGRGHLPPSSSLGHDTKRNRLHKTPPEPKAILAYKEILNAARAQSCLTVCSGAGDDGVLPRPCKQDSERSVASPPTNTKPTPHISYLLKPQQSSVSSGDTMSIYSTDEMDQQSCRRTRAKTPILAIGQLERNSVIHPIDRAQALASEYIYELPERTITPYIIEQAASASPRPRLRKIKCQVSLRDLIKSQAQLERSPSINGSDTETLVGSPTSPTSPTSNKYYYPGAAQDMPPTHAFEQDLKPDLDCPSDTDSEIGLKICLDMLTTQLATTLFHPHPAETEDQASGLEILLLIEAYEAAQRHLKQRIQDARDAHVMGSSPAEDLDAIDQVLAHWIQVLYSVYECSQQDRCEKKAVRDHWPLCQQPVVGRLDSPWSMRKGEEFVGRGENCEDIFV